MPTTTSARGPRISGSMFWFSDRVQMQSKCELCCDRALQRFSDIGISGMPWFAKGPVPATTYAWKRTIFFSSLFSFLSSLFSLLSSLFSLLSSLFSLFSSLFSLLSSPFSLLSSLWSNSMQVAWWYSSWFMLQISQMYLHAGAPLPPKKQNHKLRCSTSSCTSLQLCFCIACTRINL